MENPPERKRVFVREISGNYGMEERRQMQLGYERKRQLDRDDYGDPFHLTDDLLTYAPWRLSPSDPELLTQSIQVHFRHVAPGSTSGRHGHQNEAAFYVMSGSGYDIDDEIRYDYGTGDVLVVHSDSVHEHFNASDTEWFKTIVFKAKSLWLLLGLIEQGKSKSQPDEDFGPAVEWGDIWTPGVEKMEKVVRADDGEWVDDPSIGRVRRILDLNIPNQRIFSVDLLEQVIEPGEASVTHRHMADEAVYVTSGEGVSRQRDVRSQIDTRYHSRIAKDQREWTIKAGDVVYVPHNTIHQFEAVGSAPLRFLSAQNRLFRHLGYDNVVAYPTWGSVLSE